MVDKNFLAGCEMRSNILIIIWSLLSLLAIFSLVFITIFVRVDEIPGKSSPGKVILASDGCCFSATDLTISLLDESGNKVVLISEETVNQHYIFKCRDIPNIDAPIQVVIDFVAHYGISKNVILTVGEFPNTDDLLKDGLLLYFGDGDLMVINGNNKKFFRDGVFSDGGDDSPWYQELSLLSVASSFSPPLTL